MSQLQKECFICHKQVYLSKPSPDSKWVKTNLDGSEHIEPEAKTRATTYTSRSNTAAIQEAKITADLRTEAIAKAHEENMEASRNLTEAINGLTSDLRILADLISRYLESTR